MTRRSLWRGQSVYHLFLLVVIASGTMGCAFGDRKVALVYEPVSEAKSGSGQTVAVAKFDDLREDKVVVGEVRNAYGMKTAKVLVENQDAGSWVSNALTGELERAGVRVMKVANPSDGASNAVITGSIQELYIKMYLSYDCRAKVKVDVAKAGVPLLSREYVGRGKGLAVAGTAGEYELVAKMALQEIMKQAIPDILEAIK